ncbi:hypothetical protein DEFR109230_00865 [Deinococcus frigens]
MRPHTENQIREEGLPENLQSVFTVVKRRAVQSGGTDWANAPKTVADPEDSD